MPAEQTCQNCLRKFIVPTESECRSHPGYYSGHVVNPEDPKASSGGAEVIYYWDCCEARDAGAPGCVSNPHVAYTCW